VKHPKRSPISQTPSMARINRFTTKELVGKTKLINSKRE